MEEQRTLILNSNIRPLLFKFSYPSIIGMTISSLYNLVDTVFVGNGIGPLAIAALTIVFPLQIIMYAIGFMIGEGSASIISRSLGANNKKRALNTFGNAIIINIIINIFFMAVAYLFIEEILRFFGASPDVLPLSIEYTNIILLGFIFFSFSIFSNIIFRSEGKPRAAMYPLITGAVMNIILDPIFIFVLDMGVRGVAIATILSQIISCLVIMYLYLSGKSIFKFRKKIFRIRWERIWDILRIGFPSFLMATIDSVIFLIFNRAILYYGNDLYIAIIGIGIRMIDLTLMPIIGLTHGFSTITSFNFGAGKYKRVRAVFKEAFIWTTLIAGIGFILFMAFPGFLLRLFSSDESLISLGITPLRLVVIMLPTLGLQIMGGRFFQAIGKAMPATVITLLRQIVFLIPSIFILPLFFGLNGIWISWPVSDFLATVVIGVFIYKEFRHIRILESRSLKIA